MPDIKPIAFYASFSESRKKPRIIVAYSNGKKKAFTEKGLSNDNSEHRKLVTDKVEKLNRQLSVGLTNDGFVWENNSLTLYAAMDKYLEYRKGRVENKKLSPKTLIDNIQTITMLKAIIPDMPIAQIDKRFADLFVGKLRSLPRKNELGVTSYAEISPETTHQKPLQPRTDEDIAKQCRNMAAAFNWLQRQDFARHNPFSPLPELDIKNTRQNINIYRPSQIAAFQTYFSKKPPAHGAAFGFSMETGARAGGIVALNKKDIFTEVIDGIPANLAILHEKRNSTRVIYLTDEAMVYLNIMLEWMGRVDEYVNKFMINKSPIPYRERVSQGLVFFPFIDSHSVSQMFHRAKRRLKIKGKFHDARKTRTTDLFDLGMNRDLIKDQMGWTNDKVMDNHYLKITLNRVVREGRIIEEKKRS